MTAKSITQTLTLVIALSWSSSVFAQSDTQANAVFTIKKCTKIQSDRDRLACYDMAAGKLAAAVDSGDIVVIDKATVQEAKKEVFGLDLPTLSGIGKIFRSGSAKGLRVDQNTIQVNITSVEQIGYKKNRFILENGQVWDQVQSSSYRVPKRKKDKPYFVTIAKAALNSFNLRVNDTGKKIKVKRVK